MQGECRGPSVEASTPTNFTAFSPAQHRQFAVIGGLLSALGRVFFCLLALLHSALGTPRRGSLPERLITRAVRLPPFPFDGPSGPFRSAHLLPLPSAHLPDSDTLPFGRRRCGNRDFPRHHEGTDSQSQPKNQTCSTLGCQSCKALRLDFLGGQSYTEGKLCLTAPSVSMQAIQHRSDERITRADSAETTPPNG
jgi:hypothetical protein